MCCSWLWGFSWLRGCRDSLCRRPWGWPSLSCFASSPSALRGEPPSLGQTTPLGLPCVEEWATLLCSMVTCPSDSSVVSVMLLAYSPCSCPHEARVRSNGWIMSGKTCSLQGSHLHGGGYPQRGQAGGLPYSVCCNPPDLRIGRHVMNEWINFSSPCRSWGPMGWLIPSEVQPLETRSVGQSFATAVNFLVRPPSPGRSA